MEAAILELELQVKRAMADNELVGLKFKVLQVAQASAQCTR
jgi:hypothetical protein